MYKNVHSVVASVPVCGLFLHSGNVQIEREPSALLMFCSLALVYKHPECRQVLDTATLPKLKSNYYFKLLTPCITKNYLSLLVIENTCRSAGVNLPNVECRTLNMECIVCLGLVSLMFA